MKTLLLIGILAGLPIGQHGTVLEKTVEGGSAFNDYYIVNLDGQLYEIEADDLEINDPVTVYSIGQYTLWTKYGHH